MSRWNDDEPAHALAFATFYGRDDVVVSEMLFDHELLATAGDVVALVRGGVETVFGVSAVERRVFAEHDGFPHTLVQFVDYREISDPPTVSDPGRRLPTRKKRKR